MIPIHRIAFEIVSHRVSASSLPDSRSFTSSQWPLLTITDRLPFLNPALMTRVLSGRSCCLPKLQKDSDRKSNRFILFCGLGINFPHCFDTGVDGPWILTSNEALREPLHACSPAFIDTSQYCSKTMWTSLQLASSWHRTSFKLISLMLAAIKRRPNRSLSAPTVTSLSLVALTWTFFVVTSKV